jgi:hypothetical protein
MGPQGKNSGYSESIQQQKNYLLAGNLQLNLSAYFLPEDLSGLDHNLDQHERPPVG